MISFLVDSGFWIALFDSRDPYHEKTVSFWDTFADGSLFIAPHPTLYEFINTRLKRNKEALAMLNRVFVGNLNLCLISDEKYKDDALDRTLSDTYRHLSLVDMTIRMMLEDDTIKTDALLTTNRGDFFDVCAMKSVEIYDIGD